MESARSLTIRMLCETTEKLGYTNIILDKNLKSSSLDAKDKKFASALYYGVIERKITLDYIISKFVSKKMDSVIQQILRCGIYQIKYMDNIPDNAAVDESVKLTIKFKKKSAKGFVNAVLRNFIRAGKEVKLPSGELERMQIEYSAPENFISSLINDYGKEKTVNFLKDSLKPSDVMIRRNVRKCTKEQFLEYFDKDEIREHPEIEDCYFLKSQNIVKNKAFLNGLFHVQDAASQLCCMALDINENDKVVYDVCSAPGGKAFTIAEKLNGTLYAWDLYEKRVNLIKSGAKRLGLENIKAMQGDALNLPDDIEMADKILCDVPCSGYGVIRKKPEIKYKDINENESLPDIQYKILLKASSRLKKGGTLVYSTCTLSKAENENNVEKFLAENPDFEAVNPLEFSEKTKDMKYVTLFPEIFGSDGFFIAKLIKRK